MHTRRGMPAACHGHECARGLIAESYQRHEPEHTALYRVLSQHWPAFLQGSQQAGGLPDFVKREIEGYLTCEIMDYGFGRVERPWCGFERLVPRMVPVTQLMQMAPVRQKTVVQRSSMMRKERIFR